MTAIELVAVADEPCLLEAVDTDPAKYVLGDTIMKCPYGTIFSEENCTCILGKGQW